MIPEKLPRRVILTDDPLRARMLSAHYLEYSTLIYEAGETLVYSGSYKDAPIALASAGFGSGAVLSCMCLLGGQGAAEVIFIGGCVSSISPEMPGWLKLRELVLAEGGSLRLSSNALRAAKHCDFRVAVRAVLASGCEHPGGGCVIDDIAAALYGQARVRGIDALSILTVSENLKTGEKLDEHEKRSRCYNAARLVFETFAIT